MKKENEEECSPVLQDAIDKSTKIQGKTKYYHHGISQSLKEVAYYLFR